MPRHFTLIPARLKPLRLVAPVAVWVVLVLLVGACDQLTTSRPSAPPAPTATPTPVPNPSVTITLRGVGVRQSHESAFALLSPEDDIRLVVRINEGGRATEEVLPPDGAC